MTGPLVCHLCEDATFLYDEDFAAHKETVHLEVVPLLDRRRESFFIMLRTFSNSLGVAPRATPAREWQHLSLRQP